MQWTDSDKDRVRAYINKLLTNLSQAELARQAIGPKAARQNIRQWLRLGQVPTAYHGGLIDVAKKVGLKITPAQLHPNAKALSAFLRSPISKRSSAAHRR